MSLWRQLSRGLRALVHRSATDRDIADEVEQYVDDAAAAFEASGLAPEDARRAARRQLGSLTAVHEEVARTAGNTSSRPRSPTFDTLADGYAAIQVTRRLAP